MKSNFVAVQDTFYSTMSKGPVIKGTIKVVPNQLYNVRIEVMRSDTDNEREKIEDIIMNSDSFGSCNPDGIKDCSYYDCSQNNHGDYLTKQTIKSSDGQVNIQLTYTSAVEMKECVHEGFKVSAVARVTLTPIEGRYINQGLIKI